jgi:UDP-N-acetylmuramoyl-L-alanyl-D-glutamate--2,6-diaminopimelate ligase
MVSNTKAQKLSYGESASDFKFTIKNSSAEGLDLLIGDTEIKSPLVGKFNAYNLSAIFATAVTLGTPRVDIAEEFKTLSGARGRMDKIVGKRGIIGLIDYSHTPDALENALTTINGFKKGRVITVFGAGGDRDKSKRPLMGDIASRLSDFVIVTSDNPRSEKPEDIIQDILAGISDKTHVETILDRREAIKRAVEIAAAGDIILLAGKGHEEYQDVAGVKSHFSDREVLKEFLL